MSRCRYGERKGFDPCPRPNPGKHSWCPHHRKLYRLARTYEIPVANLERMFDAQGNACAVCRTPFDDLPPGEIHLDHDHESGEPRAWLCGPCNCAIGDLQEDPDRFAAAVAYLHIYEEMTT